MTSSVLVHGCKYFFFSSRRRHTRFKCDWSSDVCSSDLYRAEKALLGARRTFKDAHQQMVRVALLGRVVFDHHGNVLNVPTELRRQGVHRLAHQLTEWLAPHSPPRISPLRIYASFLFFRYRPGLWDFPVTFTP